MTRTWQRNEKTDAGGLRPARAECLEYRSCVDVPWAPAGPPGPLTTSCRARHTEFKAGGLRPERNGPSA